MYERAWFVDAHEIPYKVWEFSKPVAWVTLNSTSELDAFFEKIEELSNEGLWGCGYFTYELGYLLEPKLKPLFPETSFPLARFVFFEECFRKRDYFVPKSDFQLEDVTYGITSEEYEEGIKRIKHYIASGDVYQINFTFKCRFRFKGDPECFFFYLLFSQRCKYGVYLDFGEFQVLSLSPELFLKRVRGNLWSSPMKGTIKRGKTFEEDEALKRFLSRDEKNQAENVMIVDLIRNDLGRICEDGSVFVSELFKVETYPTLHQMISTIKGKLKNASIKEVFKAIFPCGSVTGAPKIRAMEIIREIEKEPRGIYTGAVGVIFPKNRWIFNVAIRTLVTSKARDGFYGEAGIGSGVVWDSRAESEFKECLLKARFFTNAFEEFYLIETIGFKGKDTPLLKYHYKRLKGSARYFGFSIPEWLKSYEKFKVYLLNRVKRIKKAVKIRISLFPNGGFEIQTDEFQPWKKDLRVALVKRDFPVSNFTFHKTSLRSHLDAWRERVLKLGFDEVVFFDEEKRLLEGSISSVFFKDYNDELLTPPLELGILRGVFREYMIKEKGVKERQVYLQDLERGEFFVGNALRGLGKVKEWCILDEKNES